MPTYLGYIREPRCDVQRRDYADRQSIQTAIGKTNNQEKSQLYLELNIRRTKNGRTKEREKR